MIRPYGVLMLENFPDTEKFVASSKVFFQNGNVLGGTLAGQSRHQVRGCPAINFKPARLRLIGPQSAATSACYNREFLTV